MTRSPGHLLSSLYMRGVKLWLEEGKIVYRAPKGTLLPQDIHEIQIFRAEIIRLLADCQFRKHISLKPRIADSPIPLTAWQRRIANHIFSAGRLSTRTCSVGVRLRGPLDTRLLKDAIEAVVHRHETLRTRFIVINGDIYQHIDEAAAWFRLEEIDLTTAGSVDQSAEVDRHSKELVTEKIDISKGPLFAARLLKLSNDEHVLILALDHLITDGTSTGILSSEIWTLYYQGTRGLPFSLPGLPIQFGDYAIWQQQTYNTWLEESEPYWRKRLTGAPPYRIPSLANLSPPPHAAEIQLIKFGDSLSTQLREAARRENTLLPLVVLTAYVGVMSRWMNQEDLVLLFYYNGRDRPELTNMIGFLVNVLFLRLEVTKHDCFLDLLRRVRLEFDSALKHQDFGRVPDLIPDCPISTELFFNWVPNKSAHVIVKQQQNASNISNIHKIDAEPLPLHTSKQDKFSPLFFETPTGINVATAYRPDLLSRNTIERFANSLKRFSAALAERPLTLIKSIRMS